MIRTLMALVICVLGIPGWVAAESQQTGKPNVIFVLVDDQGYYDLGCYGATEVETPEIDALAAEGTRFTD